MGARGEGWVIGQFVIGAGILAASFVTRVELPLWVRLAGVVLMGLGALIGGLGILQLGRNLTPFPKPKAEAHTLVRTGIYGLLRHPIYSGLMFGALGWAVWWESLLSFGLALVLCVWFEFKSRHEEAWLLEKYPDYAGYRARVKKFIPFLY